MRLRVVAEIVWETTQWRWTLVLAIILSVFQFCGGDYTLRADATHVALRGDVSVSYQVLQGSPTLSYGVVQLLDISDESREVVRATRTLPSTTSGNINFECSYFDHEGKFEFRILSESEGPAIAYSNSVHVYWPDVTITSPAIPVATLTSDVAITMSIDVPLCSDMSHNRYETTVALVYHGGQRAALISNELPTPGPNTGTVSDELPTGEILESDKQVQFYCNSIDRAGFYTFEYRSTYNHSVIAISPFLEVFSSDAYKISSPQEDVLPCNSANGLKITYEYPNCRGHNDKIRVFGQTTEFSRQPAPGTLEYITEEGAYDVRAVDFFCEHFTVKYKGYCFTYVSVARSGAVDNHVMTCIPTNGTGTPLNGAWSMWSSWGDCTVTCGGGVRYRYRLCNNPTPVNGGASCLGDAVDSEECPYLTCPTDTPVVTYPNPDGGINVIPGCNCGCVLREINGTISSSPGSCTTGFGSWKVLVADGLRIQLDFRSFDLYLHEEWLRIRDGASESARVVAYHTGSKIPASITSTRNELYLEYKVTGKDANQPRGFSAVYLTFENTQYNTPITSVPAVVESGKSKQDSSLPLGSVNNFVMILGVFFCTFVIILSVACTGYAGWKRKKLRTSDGREDSGFTACRSSASGHSIERAARGVVVSESSASELSTFSNNKRGCPDGRFIDRSSLYMVKDETGMTYLPESNLSSPSHTDVDGTQMKTIPEVPHSPYTQQDGNEEDEELTRCEVTLPYHLGPGSIIELSSDRHTVKSDRNSSNLAIRSVDKNSSRSSHQSVRGSQNSVYGSQGGGSGMGRSHRSGSSSGSVSRKLKVRGDLLLSPLDTDIRVLDGSEHPDTSHSSGARRKRRTSPSGSHNSHSNPSHRSSYTSPNESNHSSHNSHRRHRTSQQGNHDKHRDGNHDTHRNGNHDKHRDGNHDKHRDHHGDHKGRHRGHRSRRSGDFDHTGNRSKHDNIIYSDMEPRPPVAGESPTTQVPRHLPKPPSRGAYEQHHSSKETPKPEVEPRTNERYNGAKRHSMPTPSSYSNEVFDIGFGTNLGPREPIWPGKSPSTEGASDTNSRESRNSHNSKQNRLETAADIESPSFDDGKPKRRGKHKSSRHKGKTSAGSADDDPIIPSRSTSYSNVSSEQDQKTDPQTDSLYSEPSTASPLHVSYLNNRQRPDYMKSVFISDESLARTYSGGDNSAQTSRTTTPRMSHRKLPDTPPVSGLSSPSKSLTCVPIYSDGIPIDGLDEFEFDEFIPHLPGALVVNQIQPTMSPSKKPGHLDKGEAEKQEIIKVNGLGKDDKLFEASGIVNGTKPVAAPRRTRPRRGPLSSAAFV